LSVSQWGDKLRARIELEIQEPEIVVSALRPDDIEWVKCYADCNKLMIEAETDKMGAMLNALDDYMVNIKVAVSILKLLN